MSYNKLDPLNECCCQSEIPSVYESDLSIPEQVQRNSNDIDVLKKNNANITVDLVNTKKTVEANRKGIENLKGSIPTKLSDLQPDSQHMTVSQNEKDKWNNSADNKEDFATVKSNGIPEIKTKADFLTYFYNLRKSTSRKWQLEISTGSNENIITAIGGLPAGVTVAEKGFLYIEIPYSEAGGFVIVVTFYTRTSGKMYEKRFTATVNSNWKETLWIDLTGQADKSVNTRLNAVTEQTTANLEAISLLEQQLLEHPEIPSPMVEDYGKFLMVTEQGSYGLVRVPTAEGAEF